VESSKVKILAENKKKSGIYMWKNKLNGKIYVGSGVDLSRRLSKYYLPSFMQAQLAKGGKSAIYSAILKHGYQDFSLYILEYCDISRVLETEQKYLDLYKPEYNLLLIAGSRQGHIVSDETRAKMSKAFQGLVVSEEGRKNIGAGQGTPVIVLDLKTNTSTEYLSISDVARFFNIYTKKIYRCVHEKKLYLDRYQIILQSDNPEYKADASLQVAVSSAADINHIRESLQASFLSNANPLYMYDTEYKEYIYKAESQTKLGVDLGVSSSNILISLNSGQPYLGRFLFSATPLSSGEYTEKLLDIKNLLELVKGVGKEYRLAIIKILTKGRDLASPQHKLVESKQVKITNINTQEVSILDSRQLAAKYISLLDPDFKCSAGMVSDCIKLGRIYKKTFKFEEVV